MTGILVILQPLLPLGKPFCFSYIHWTKQHDPKLAELCGKEKIVKINTTEFQTLPALWQHISKKILYWKEYLQPNFPTLENRFTTASVTLKCIKRASIKHRLSCHHIICMWACWQMQPWSCTGDEDVPEDKPSPSCDPYGCSRHRQGWSHASSLQHHWAPAGLFHTGSFGLLHWEEQDSRCESILRSLTNRFVWSA